MKKFLSLLVVLLILCGCSNNKNGINYTYEIESYDVDMSCYDGVNSTNHMFRRITVDQLFNCIDKKSSGAFYLGRENCGCCQTCLQYLDKASRELGVTIYYIDVYDKDMPITDKDTVEKLREYMSPILAMNDEGQKELQTPTVFSVVNGEFKDSIICLANYAWDTPPTTAQEDKLINKYKQILSPFVD